MDASEVSASELLPSTGAEGELSGGSEEEGLARRKDELVSSWIQVKWFCASVLLKADSLNMLLRVRRPCEDIFFYRFYQSYHGRCWMQYTILFHGNSQGPHHSTMNLFTGGADLSTKTETAGTASSPTWAGGDATLHRRARDCSASQAADTSQAIAGCSGHAASRRPHFSRHLSLIGPTWSKAVSMIRQDAIACPGAARWVRRLFYKHFSSQFNTWALAGPVSHVQGSNQRNTIAEPWLSPEHNRRQVDSLPAALEDLMRLNIPPRGSVQSHAQVAKTQR